MKQICRKTIISLSLLLSIIVQPMLVVAMPCPMQSGDMTSMVMADHMIAQNVTDHSMPASDCCAEDNGCSMPSCVVVALQFSPSPLIVPQSSPVNNFYSPLYSSVEQVSLYRPPITR